MAIDKINNVSSISKINNTAIANVDEVMGKTYSAPAPSFADNYAVSKSITTGTAQAVYISNDGGAYDYIHSSAYTISFWVRAGWSSGLNTNIHLFAMNTSGSTNASDNMIRIFYNESNNRVYFEYRSASNAKKSNFWLFHANSGNYAAAYSAAGLGGSYWSSANRGNTGNDDFTMITMTKGTSNNAGSSNVNFYWNATDCGIGFYGANGFSQGTPNMSTGNRNITIGSNANIYTKCGNNSETLFNDLTIWNKKLSAAEVSSLYNSGARSNAVNHSATSDLQGYYTFENNGNDSSGNSNAAFTVSGNSNFESI